MLEQYNRTMSNYVSYSTNTQIVKDITRTFSHFKYFDRNLNDRGFHRLHRLLIALTTYRNIGYIQGLNFIAASFLWHCDEELAYFIIVELFCRIQMESLFKENMRGVHAKSDVFFGQVLSREVPGVYNQLVSNNIPGIMILTEWIITLGFSVVPIEHHIRLIKGLLESHWVYLYGVMVQYYKIVDPIFRQLKFDEGLIMIKRAHEEDVQKKFGYSIDWVALLGHDFPSR